MVGLAAEQRLLIQHIVSTLIIEAGLFVVRLGAPYAFGPDFLGIFVKTDEFAMFAVFAFGLYNLGVTLWNNRERPHVFVLP